MGQHGDSLSRPTGRHRDGALLCTLCVDTRPNPDNDWCRAIGCVLCDDCCRAMMMGDERLLAAASDEAGRDLAVEDVVEVCASCPRLVRLVSEHALEDETEVRFPMH